MCNLMSALRPFSIFLNGFVAGLAALAFNFLLRLGGIAPFPPETALNAFLSVVPASIEEPMVQSLGDLAGQLGLLVATLIAAIVYGLLLVVFDRAVANKLGSRRLSNLEGLLVFSLVPWVFYGLFLLPLLGGWFFGDASAFASPSDVWAFPFTLLLVQWVFVLVAAPRYILPRQATQSQAASGSRREFIEKGALGLLAIGAAILSLTRLGSLFSSSIQPSGGSQPIDLAGAPAIFSDPRLATLVESEVTTNDSFYRVAIDVIDPTVDAIGWTLLVDGLVGSPKRYSLQGIEALPQTNEYNTFECVSNKVNGPLIGNAKWTGPKLSDLFQDVGGVLTGATYVVFYSVDGYSVGIPLAKALMPDSILAYQMNDQALPVKHGYPLRAVIPGLYGMMSAKWVNRISVVGAVYDGYWQTRGWTNDASVNTLAFVVIPYSGAQLSLLSNGGSIMVAGFAYAGDRGISKVEVSFDGGKTWDPATLKPPISSLTWTLWAYEWRPPNKGEYAVLARATDGAGQVQTSIPADTFPNGATGYAFISTTVVD